MSKEFKLGLVPRLLIGIALGLVCGMFFPLGLVRALVTVGNIFGSYLSFLIPLLILSFVTSGICHLTSGGAGRLLLATVVIAYCSTLLAGSFAYAVDATLFPHFITSDIIEQFSETTAVEVEPFINFTLNTPFDVTCAIVLAFIFGIGILALNSVKGMEETAQTMTKLFDGFQTIISLALQKTILPILPFYIGVTFCKMSFTGEVWSVFRVFWKVYVVIICLHLIYLTFLYCVAGSVSKKSPLFYMKNQIPGYVTAIGTQSSAMTIPVNVSCAEKNGVSKGIREFVVPLCATIHLAGSTMTILSCALGVLMMSGMDHSFGIIFPFVMTLGVVMIAAPGAPGGAVMSALSFLPMIGIPVEGALASLMIALYLTQDSFGTACNVSGDNALAIIIDTFKDRISGNKKAA